MKIKELSSPSCLDPKTYVWTDGLSTPGACLALRCIRIAAPVIKRRPNRERVVGGGWMRSY